MKLYPKGASGCLLVFIFLVLVCLLISHIYVINQNRNILFEKNQNGNEKVDL
jgi:hypothetical protein